ncbi:MAG: MarR family transcriptional regulator, partial [Bacillota bacterium]
ADKPVKAGDVVEATGLDKKEVDKIMAKLKKEGKIVSPKRCFWEAKK